MIDFTGQHIGLLTVLYCDDDKMNKYSYWWCKCDCGNEELFKRSAHCLRYGQNQSCGCYKKTINKKINKYIINSDNTVTIFTNNNDEFIIDYCDLDKIIKYCWHTHQDGYLRTCYDTNNRHNKYILLHKLLFDDFENLLEIDHINGNPKDNRRCNLRIVNHSNNMKNTKTSIRNKSGHKGVYYSKRECKWKAVLYADNKRYHLGTFDKFEDAVAIREKAELKYFGEYNREEKGD